MNTANYPTADELRALTIEAFTKYLEAHKSFNSSLQEYEWINKNLEYFSNSEWKQHTFAEVMWSEANIRVKPKQLKYKFNPRISIGAVISFTNKEFLARDIVTSLQYMNEGLVSVTFGKRTLDSSAFNKPHTFENFKDYEVIVSGNSKGPLLVTYE